MKRDVERLGALMAATEPLFITESSSRKSLK